MAGQLSPGEGQVTTDIGGDSPVSIAKNFKGDWSVGQGVGVKASDMVTQFQKSLSSTTFPATTCYADKPVGGVPMKVNSTFVGADSESRARAELDRAFDGSPHSKPTCFTPNKGL